ncbi:MAG: hypothetical protein LRZ97_00835 [Candidatus Pacebacteria bacterium]|nr:hypothetical protein [Candidatus Paceibacterota bacterium]
MYLADIITKKNKEMRVENILSKVLKIKNTEKSEMNIIDEKETVKFLSEQMLREIRKAFK